MFYRPQKRPVALNHGSMNDFNLDSYNYHLPPELIAQKPAPRREGSRLMILDRDCGTISDTIFSRIPDIFHPGDLILLNNTRVFPARLPGRKKTGGKCEVFLLDPPPPSTATAMRCLLKSSRRPKPGQEIIIADDFSLEVIATEAAGDARVKIKTTGDKTPAELLDRYGQVPLPPYIKRKNGNNHEDRERYQTVYAEKTGAVAAPTAGLHFSAGLLAAIRARGVDTAQITLHVGYGTFAPVKADDIRGHRIHREWIDIPAAATAMINQAREKGRRIWAVGTTSVRAVESVADERGRVSPGRGWCSHYIYPGYRFRVVDNLITNFHLPRSSLLFMVAAMAGRREILAAYAHAVAEDYRFFSYGDAMAIITRT